MIDAFNTAVVGTRQDLVRALRQTVRGSASERLLGAVVAQHDGDVDAAIRQLRGLVATDPEAAPFAADLLAPILISRRGNEAELSRLAETLETAGWRASAAAFRAHLEALAGATTTAVHHLELASQLLEQEDDAVMQSRLKQRVGLAAFYLQQYESAMTFALGSAADASRHRSWRTAAAAYTVAYNISMDVTGDVEEADRYARLWRNAAARCEDASFLRPALVAEFELAVQSADEARIGRLRAQIRRRVLPPLYMEQFTLVFSEAVFCGTTDLRAFASLLHVLRDGNGRSRGETALCTALIALSCCALFDDDAARAGIREAVKALGRAHTIDPAYERRYRRLARVAAAAACAMLGDHLRGQRLLQNLEMRSGQGEENLLSLASSGQAASAPKWQKGFALLLEAAFSARRSGEPPVPLTRAEFDVLRLLDAGYGARRIASESGRSVYTVYNHTRAILAKFGAKRAAEAVAMARRNGMLR